MSLKEAEVTARLQAFILGTWARTREAIQTGEFTVCLHASDAAPEAGAAILNTPAAQAAMGEIDAVREIFQRRGRHSRIVFLEAYAPRLMLALRGAGFVETGRETVMVCARDTLIPAPPISGLSVDTQSAQTPLDEVREGYETNERGFNPDAGQRATTAEIEQFRRELVGARAFLARLDGRPVAAGMFSAPADGVTELLGITTLPPFRRRGIAQALTARMSEVAFEHGCDLLFLRPTDEAAARVYARAGFRPTTRLLTYTEREAASARTGPQP